MALPLRIQAWVQVSQVKFGFLKSVQTVKILCPVFLRNMICRFPGTEEFPNYAAEIEKYDQENPEFLVVTTPMEIPQKKSSGRASANSIEAVHLMFMGEMLKDGSYEFTIAEIEPVSAKQHTHINKFIDREQPVEHKFRFSNDCRFQEYHIRRASSLNFKKTGFFVSADSNCEFNEPQKQESGGLTAYLDELNSQVSGLPVRLRKPDYFIFKYPAYYRGLCALAKPLAK